VDAPVISVEYVGLVSFHHWIYPFVPHACVRLKSRDEIDVTLSRDRRDVSQSACRHDVDVIRNIINTMQREDC